MINVYSSKHESLNSIIKQIFLDFDLLKQKKVFIKPNLGGRCPIIKGENTRYDVLRNLCKVLEENGCQEIVIGHGSLLNFGKAGYDFEALLINSNFYKLSKYKIVRFLNLDNADKTIVKVKDITFTIPDICRTHFYINLCNVKTHMETTVSLSLKNQVGLLPQNERMRKHQTNLDKHIALLGVAVKPHLIITDGRVGMEGNGPHHGTPKHADMILCGDDMVEVDSLICRLMGIDFESVGHIKFAMEEKVGYYVSEKQYSAYKQYSVKFRPPDEFYGKYRHIRVWPNKACSACIFNLSDAHKAIRKNPVKLIKFINKLVKSKKFDIILGKGAEVNARKYSNDILVIGNCAEDFVKFKNLSNYLPGCPPSKESIINFLLKG